MKRFKSREEGYHTWSEGEVAQFESHHPDGSKARLVLALALYTSQRISDVVRMGWQHVQGDRIAVWQEKTDTPLLIKMHPELLRVLATVPKTNMTFVLTPHGKPFTAQGMSNWFGKRCREAGLSHCSAIGCASWEQRGWRTLARATNRSSPRQATNPQGSGTVHQGREPDAPE